MQCQKNYFLHTPPKKQVLNKIKMIINIHFVHHFMRLTHDWEYYADYEDDGDEKNEIARRKMKQQLLLVL